MRRRKRNPEPNTWLMLGLIAAGVIGAYFLAKKIGAAAGAVGTAINPLSTGNLAYRGAGALTQAITGNRVDSFGTAIANLFPSKAEQAVNVMLKPAPIVGITGTPGSFGPTPEGAIAATAPYIGTAPYVPPDLSAPLLFGLPGNLYD